MSGRVVAREATLLVAVGAVAFAACGGGGGGGAAAPTALSAHAAAHPDGAAGTTDAMAGMDMSGTAMASVAPSASVHGFRLNVPLPRPDFTLTDTGGHPYDFAARTRGHATLLYFGYTRCPYQCPTTMADVGVALAKLPASVRDRVTVVFVTTDARYDTPKALGAWLANFDPHIVGLTGTAAQLVAAQHAARVTVSLPKPGEPAPAGPASTAHGGGMLAYGLDDYAHVTYPAGTAPADLVRDLPALVAGTA